MDLSPTRLSPIAMAAPRPDGDAVSLLNMLEAVVAQAGQVEAQHERLQATQQQELTVQRAAVEADRASVDTLRAKCVQQGMEEASQIIARARAEEEVATQATAATQKRQEEEEAKHLAEMAKLRQEQAIAAAEHVALMQRQEMEQAARAAAAEDAARARHRAMEEAAARRSVELERENTTRLDIMEKAAVARLRELERDMQTKQSEHEACLARLDSDHAASLRGREAEMDRACLQREERLLALGNIEEQVQQRAAELRQLAEGDGGSQPVVLHVGGHHFTSTVGHLSKYPRSLFAVLLQQQMNPSPGAGKSEVSPAQQTKTPPAQPAYELTIDGNPTHFQLVLHYLRRGKCWLSSLHLPACM